MEVRAQPIGVNFGELHRELLDHGMVFLRYERVKKRAHGTLKYMSTPGPLLTEPDILWDVRAMGYELDPDRDNKSRYDVASVYHSLARYGKRVDLSRMDRGTLEDAKAITMRAFGSKGSVLDVLPLDESLRDVVKMDKSAGLPEMGKKSDAFDADLGRALRIISGSKKPDPCVAFHRVQHGEEGPKTRLVWGYPQAMTLIEARFAVPLIERYLDVSTPMVLGLRKMQLGARMLRASNAGVQYGLDFSRYDASVAREFIHFAFEVLSTFFDLNSEERKAWDRVRNYFVFTPIMMPDRSVWLKDHGVPSGSFFTQMVDSIVNHLMVVYALLRAGGRKPAWDEILVLGDDALVGYHEFVTLDTLRKFFLEGGLTLNVAKTKVTFWSREGPSFLGHSWISGVATRPERELLQRMAFPEKPSRERNAKVRAATRRLSIATSAASGHDIISRMSPYKGPDILARYLAIGRKGGLTDSRTRVTPDLLPGWREHLEDLGVGERVVAASLSSRLPYTGILL